MNKTVQLLIVGFAIILSSCSDNETNKIPETEMEKVSYSLGVNVATGVKAQGLDTIDANAVAKAFKDVFEGNDLDISEEESMEVEIAKSLSDSEVDVAEMNSPPQVTKETKKFGLQAGMAFDLSIGWDFSLQVVEQMAKKYVEEKMPKLVIGSPMCTTFSRLQNLTPLTPEKSGRWSKTREYIKFITEIYKIQINGSRLSLRECSAGASLWDPEEMRGLEKKVG